MTINKAIRDDEKLVKSLEDDVSALMQAVEDFSYLQAKEIITTVTEFETGLTKAMKLGDGTVGRDALDKLSAEYNDTWLTLDDDLTQRRDALQEIKDNALNLIRAVDRASSGDDVMTERLELLKRKLNRARAKALRGPYTAPESLAKKRKR